MDMLEMNKLEQAVLDRMLDGDHPLLEILRTQSQTLCVSSREYTDVGFFCALEVDLNVPIVSTDFEISDVNGELGDVSVGFVLFVRDGRLRMLEGFTFDEKWPTHFDDYRLRYDHQPRKLSLPIQ